ncbi:MAG: leucine-rich repeat protein [Clostridia bacterium]|nr:leucine-rich repeat protein [Clostridia bacterium]
MALYFIKDTTLKGIADAIRTKTGDTASIPVARMASKIASISVGESSGGSSGENDSGYTTKIITASGTFNTATTGTGRQTISHGLSAKPDMVVVYLKRTADYSVTTKYCTILNTSKNIGLGGVAVSGAYSFATGGCLEEYGDNSQIYCPDNSTFQVGSDGTFLENVEYCWQAMAVIKSEATSGGDHTVTFMSEDGTTVLCRKTVMNGDTCGDPVTQKLIEIPTKESTAQFDYSFLGWSLTPGGEADDNALADITSDRTVYASFAGLVRFYTIKYYDGDSVIHSEILAYGLMPSYVPARKDGYMFTGWTPELATVTCDADYYAQWIESIGGSCGDSATWSISSDRVLTIAGSGAMTDYTDPTSTNSTNPAPWFEHSDKFDKVVIAEGITYIGNFAFYKCANVTAVTIAESVTSTGTDVFSYTSITNIVFPDNCTNIGARNCQYCIALLSFTLPATLTVIPAGLTVGCSGLQEYIIPDSVTSIPMFAFSGLSGLKRIVIGSGVTSISRLTMAATSVPSVEFKNATGWYVTTTENATSGTNIDVSDPSTAATYLHTTYKQHYWYRK